MSDIDHAAEAREILGDIDNAGPDDNLPMDWCGATPDEQWLVMGSLAQAQVHATLALVAATEKAAEQARIATLAALANLGMPEQFDEPVNHLSAEALHALCGWELGGGTQFSGPDEFPVIRDDIRKGLGL